MIWHKCLICGHEHMIHDEVILANAKLIINDLANKSQEQDIDTLYFRYKEAQRDIESKTKPTSCENNWWLTLEEFRWNLNHYVGRNKNE